MSSLICGVSTIVALVLLIACSTCNANLVFLGHKVGRNGTWEQVYKKGSCEAVPRMYVK